MPAVKSQTEPQDPDTPKPATSTPETPEIVTEPRLTKYKHAREGEQWERDVPVGKRVPVLLIETPDAFTERHERLLRAEMRDVIKKHARAGKLYFEVGESDDAIEGAIKQGIAFLHGQGIAATRSIEFTPHMTRGEW